MREVLSVHVGQAGIQLGKICWELFCLEHDINPNGLMTPDVFTNVNDSSLTFFQETGAGKYVPRAILLDLEPSVIDETKHESFHGLFSKDLMFAGKEDAANNFARGYYSQGPSIMGPFAQGLRKILELYDNLQGFIVYHSLGGGTGSGLTPLLASHFRDYYGTKNIIEITIFPSPSNASAIVEPYNAILGSHSIMNHSDCNLLIDNRSVEKIAKEKLNIQRPTFININRMIALVVSSVTASLRWGGNINADLKSIQTNLVPYPRIHFPMVSYSPFIPWERIQYNLPTNQIINECFEIGYQMLNCNVSRGYYISCCVLMRGDTVPRDVNATICKLKSSRCLRRIDWCPTVFKVGFNDEPPHAVYGADFCDAPRACCMLSNTTAIKDVWSLMNTKFHLMFSKRAFTHWYLAEGMELDEFRDARENLAALEMDYNEMEIQKCPCNPCYG